MNGLMHIFDKDAVRYSFQDVLPALIAIHRLSEQHKFDYYLTGSLSFIFYGVFSRKVGDLDIIIPEKYGDLIIETIESTSDTGDNIKGTMVEGIKVDFFLLDNNDFYTVSHIQKEIEGINFKIADPSYSIEGKKKIATFHFEKFIENNNEESYHKLMKHLNDIHQYDLWMNRDLPF